jgi:hypothetical protein
MDPDRIDAGQAHAKPTPPRRGATGSPDPRPLRQLHPAAGAADLPAMRPEDSRPVPRLRPGHLPFSVEVIQTDNGEKSQSAFHWHVLDKDIAHTYIKPAPPT